MSTLSTASDEAVSGARIQGRAYGGQSPLTGASIYLYAAGTGGYGGAALSLLKTTSAGVNTDANGLGYVTTGAGGSFNITGDYLCASSTTQLYMVALGGNPGLTGTINNSGIGELLALGSCGQYSSSSTVTINELSTVAAATALQQFMTAGTVNISTSPTNIAGLANAFVTATNMVNPAFISPNMTTPSGLGVIPYQELNTLADVLSTCVNTGLANSSSCTTLFTAATPPSGSAPLNTLQAMMNIARYPAQNVATLFNMVAANPPFQPTLQPTSYSNGQPNDWTMAITYFTGPFEGNVFPSLSYLAIDSKANVWAVGNGHAYQFSNAGALNYNVSSQTIQSNNFNQVLAVDLNDNLWIDDNSYSVTEVTSTGGVNCAAGNNPYCYIPGIGSNYASVYGSLNILNEYGGIAIDGNNLIWPGTGGALAEVNQAGIGVQDYIGRGIANPTSVAIDASGNFWLTNYSGGYNASGNTISVVSPSGAAVGLYSGGGMNSPIAIAFDHSGNAWVGNEAGYTLTELSSTGVASANSPISGGGMYFVSDVAVDGLNNIWVSSYDSAALAEFNSAGVALTPSTGYFDGSGSDINSVAIDSSGNVWATTFDSASVNEMVGIGAPTVTPVAMARKNGTVGTRP